MGAPAHTTPPQLAQSRSIASLGRREDSRLLGRAGTNDPDWRPSGRGGRGKIGSPGASGVPGRRRAAAARARRRHRGPGTTAPPGPLGGRGNSFIDQDSPALERLTNVEHSCAVSDVLGEPPDAATRHALPSDPTQRAFDNNVAQLQVSSTHAAPIIRRRGSPSLTCCGAQDDSLPTCDAPCESSGTASAFAARRTRIVAHVTAHRSNSRNDSSPRCRGRPQPDTAIRALARVAVRERRTAARPGVATARQCGG